MPKLISIHIAAQRIGKCADTLRNWYERGYGVPIVREGDLPNAPLMVDEVAFERWYRDFLKPLPKRRKSA